MKRHRTWMTIGAAFALLLSVAACGAGTTSDDDVDADGLTEVNLTVLPITNVAPVQIAIDQGFFADQGLEVKVSYATTGAAIVPGVLNGSVDIGYSNLPAEILASSEGLPLVSIATSDGPAASATEDTNALVVRANDDIDDAADLNGRTVAVNALGGLIYLITRASADNLGGDSSSYEFVEIPFPDMLGALQDGRIDAASITEPFLTTALDSGDFTRLFNTGSLGGQQPELIFDTYFTSEETLGAKPGLIDGFRAAMYEANAYASENPGDARAAVGKYTETDPAVLKKMTLPIWADAALSQDDFESIVSLMQKYGLLDSDKIPSYADLIRE